jgi:cytochrome d ubiquinol oxidase subunit II
MTDLTPDLVPLWTLLLALGILLYVLLDGFDLGVGILYCFAPDAASRTLLMNSIAPVWDGNETWLVLAGLALMAAFPLAFAILLPAMYFPIIVMLLALVFRGVAFEFRYKDAAHRTFWDYAFCYGSAVATFAQGIVIGAYIQGFKINSRQFVGSSFDCFTLFSLFTGIALLFGYGLLGTGWLILKTEGTLQDWARHLGRRCLVGVAIALVVVSLWTPATDAAIARRWFSWSDLPLLAPIPVMTALLVIWEWRSLGKRSSEIAPFVTAVGIFALSYAGIVISLWPMIVPHRYSLWEAASSTSTQVFLVVGTVFLLPIIFMYTAWSYWVFRGKVRGEIGYSVSVLNDVAARNHRTNLVPGACSDERE